jgi:hypothetical protein
MMDQIYQAAFSKKPYEQLTNLKKGQGSNGNSVQACNAFLRMVVDHNNSITL